MVITKSNFKSKKFQRSVCKKGFRICKTLVCSCYTVEATLVETSPQAPTNNAKTKSNFMPQYNTINSAHWASMLTFQEIAKSCENQKKIGPIG